MKKTNMIRPLFVLGVIVIGLAVISWLTRPAFRNSPLGWVTLFLAVVIGVGAIAKDLVALSREMKEWGKKE